MVSISPTGALLQALQSQFAAARQGGRGRDSAIPGLNAPPGEEGAALNALNGGIAGGGVPLTSTSGSSVGNALLGGGGGGAGDPLSRQVLSSGALRPREPNNPSGASQGEFDNLQGGDANLLKSILSGNLPLMLGLLGSAIADEGSRDIGTLGIANADRNPGTSFSSTSTGLTTPRGNIGSLGISNRERERFGPGDPGGTPNRGTGPSNSGR